ncbi:MAG: glycosyltransferase family 39 protein [Bdellovibrionales bacterium]|nr:glycosyltransferase family 39 protein [Bdellovibrionales bacterium]
MRLDVPHTAPNPTLAGPLRYLLGICLVGLLLRCMHLDERSIWLDEVTSLSIASLPYTDILQGVGFDRHTPPFYYLALHAWLLFAPATEIGLRAFSTVFDVVNIFLLGVLLMRCSERRIALTGALLYAVSPFAIYYAQEGRMYTLVVSLVLATFLLAVRAAHASVTAAQVGMLVLTATAGMYTHYYYALSLAGISLGLTWVARRNLSRLVRWYGALTIVGVLFLPWIQVVLELAGSGGQEFRRFVFLVLPYALFRFSAGYAVLPLNYDTKEHVSAAVISEAPAVISYMAAFGLMALWGLWRLRSNRIFAMFCGALLLPPLAALIVSLRVPMLSERYLVVSFPFFIALLAVTLIEAPRLARRIALIALLPLVSWSLWAHYFSPEFSNTQWRAVAQYLSEHSDTTRTVVVRPGYTASTLRFYLRDELAILPIEELPTSQDSLWLVDRGPFDTALPLAGYEPILDQLFPLGNGLRLQHLRRSEPLIR